MNRLPRPFLLLASAAMVLVGLSLVIWSLARMPRLTTASSDAAPVSASAEILSAPTGTPAAPPAAGPTTTADQDAAVESPTTAWTPTPAPVVVSLARDLPGELLDAAAQTVLSDTEASAGIHLVAGESPTATLRLNLEPAGGAPVYRAVYAVASRFDTIHPVISSTLVVDLWRGQAQPEVNPYTQVAVLSETLPALVALLGPTGPGVQGYGNMDALTDRVWADRETLALVPFHRLNPELAAFAVDGQNPVENDNRFHLAAYPFVLTVYAHAAAPHPRNDQVLAALLARSGRTNRDPAHLTVLAMTGVTAMVRQTGARMEKYGPTWAAEVIGPELAAADITHVSNEVPFVPGCQIDTNPELLTFCSPPSFLEALEAVGADIIGLTGNHQNDYGRADALASLDIYAEAGLPVYGGGRNKEEAFRPLYYQDHGNRLAFLGANSYGPPFAWATDDGPGSAEFDLNILSATIRNIKAKDKAELVLVELQYQESYDVQPLFEQRQDFRALIRAGADIVTGVQSHVPQAFEFQDGRLIAYGLGNLFFDQMGTTTREGLILKHTFYQGRHISTQVLTTRIYDYGQPHWATPEEREQILRRVFAASYWERPRGSDGVTR
ncbi:MAG: hypothetical protein D6790_13845 [Caldilineae bacterium]|nr:MAG: hypothetical protein D6790_13845 [Caldilineae bacterium]